jgi:hypothetical protein
MAGNKHQLFLIHGMGKHDDGWSDGMEAAIRTAFKSLTKLSFMDFDANFEFVPITYDGHFNELRKQWAKMGKSLTSFLGKHDKGGELGDTGKVVAKLANASDGFDKDDFIRTHLLDVFLYRFAFASRHKVRTHVSSEILRRLAKLQKSGALRWSIIAHSLGTSVAHDALHEMFSQQDVKTEISLGRMTYPNALVMLANVSRVLESDIDVFTSLVAPGAPDASRFAVRHYVNAFHALDPIPAVGPFEPVPTWPAPAIRTQGLYTHARVHDIEEVDVHSAEHHIRNPKVHVPMFNALLNTRMLGDAELKEAYEKYRSLLPVNKMNELIDELKSFNPKAGDTPGKLLRKWRDFLDRIKEGEE